LDPTYVDSSAEMSNVHSPVQLHQHNITEICIGKVPIKKEQNIGATIKLSL